MSGNGPRRCRPGRLFHREVVEAANLLLALSRTIVPRLKRFGVLAVSPSPALSCPGGSAHEQRRQRQRSPTPIDRFPGRAESP